MWTSGISRVYYGGIYMLKKEFEIRRLLNNNKYHLCVTYDLDSVKWSLYKKYDGWLEDGSKPIMTNLTHTEKDLMNFAKKHREYNANDFYIRTAISILIIEWVLIFGNCIFRSDILRGIILGMNICLFVLAIVSLILISHNQKVIDRELKEKWEELLKRYDRRDM